MLKRFITKHFGGIPTKISDLEWLIRVNPESTNSTPQAFEYRKVSPGNQPDYQAPKTEKLFKNRYYEKDTRRQYPQTVVFSPNDVKLIGTGDKFEPPVINNRYKYKASAPHLDPTGSAANPEFSIRAVE
ncbi:hypothetical protein HDV01_006901 [Terramyces sp. JEL0728]|nr:hypothetical protein HDV01_006901 [Terramyces sp. JEL0728]